MRDLLSLTAAFAFVGLFGTAPVLAEDANEVSAAAKADFNKRIYLTDPGKDKTYACFVRAYDADHLTRHPHQKVSAMKLLMTAEWSDEDKMVSHSFRLGFKYRNKSGEFDSSGACNHAKFEEADHEVRMACGVDCDGGGINVAAGKDEGSARVRLERVRVWQNNKPDEEESAELVAGKDDSLFRLERVSLSECTSLVTDRKELAAMRRKPASAR